jgi:crotonobetainyl-CoA:carnitine CoA-transferase CaiB-like acyl-CoA transferase
MSEVLPHSTVVAGPLAGTRVLELTHAVAGPFAGRILADLGADVIKIESSSGDFGRALATVGDDSMMFNHANAGKRSAVVDLKSERGKSMVRRLIEQADIVLENFTPGVLDRLGFGYASLQALNPLIIVCSVSSYGQFGSYSTFVGADPVGQAMSGMVAMTGEPDGTPYMATNGIADTSTATHAAVAILGALISRDRDGVGCHLDISMCDVMLFMDCCNAPLAAAAGPSLKLERSGPHNLTVSPFGVFAARDGYLLIEAWGEGPTSLWGRLTRLMGRPELIDDPDFQTNAARIRNRNAVTEIIEAWLSGLTRDEAMTGLHAARVVAAPVLTPYEATQHPVVRERAMLGTVTLAGGASVEAIANPYRGTAWSTTLRPGPALGEHSVEVAREAGLSETAISELLSTGALGPPAR